MYKKVVSAVEENQKIFKYLLRTSDATKIFLHKLFRKKKISVNGKPITKDYILKENDLIYCKDIFEKDKFIITNELPEIIYNDKNLIVVDKNVGESVYGEKTSVIYKVKNFLKKNNIDSNFLVPVHRLDKETTGILIFALNYRASKVITEMFRRKKIKKFYEAVLCGKIYKNIFAEAVIKREKDKNLSTVESLKTQDVIPEKNEWIRTNLKKSATIIRPLQINENFTFCEIEIWTGNHHQIRAICGNLNHPLVNDTKYGGKKIDFLDHYILNCKRIEIPILNLKFESKKRIDFENLIKQLNDLNGVRNK